MKKVRSVLWTMTAGAAALIGAVAHTASPYQFKTLRPGPVIAKGTDGFVLSGMFTVARSTEATAIEDRSYGSGGACIYGDLAAVGAPEVSCTNNAQCTEAWAGFHDENLDNPKYDAAAFGGSSNTGQCIANRCWYRPGPLVCTRKIPPDSFALGVHEFGPFDLHHVKKLFGETSRIDWQVVTCSNHAQPNGTDDTACRTGQGIYNPPADSTDAHATDWESVVRRLDGG